jgi:hypothetical protein
MTSKLARFAVRAAWPTIRQMGFRKFLVAFGLYGFALPLGLGVWLLMWVLLPVFLEPDAPPDLSYLGSRPFWLSLVSSAVLWPIGGWALAKWEWMRNERRFNHPS